MLVLLDFGDDIVRNEILAHFQGVIELNVLDREVNQVDGVVDGQSHNGRMVIREDGRNTEVKRLLGHPMSVQSIEVDQTSRDGKDAYSESRTKVTLLLHQSAHLALTVHRSARGELAGLFERHDCVYNGLEAAMGMVGG